MKTITIRADSELEKMLSEINIKPTPAAQAVQDVFLWMRRATLHELKGRFIREEIIALADSFNGLIPTWQIMCNPQTLVMHTEDAEKYQYSASSNGADIERLTEKLQALTCAQATILQLELWAFWNRDENTDPDIEVLIKTLL